MDRRQFLRRAGASAGLLAAARLPFASAQEPFPDVDQPFGFGVASGDPTPHSSIIWTRVTPEPGAVPGSATGRRVPVRWQIARDERFTKILRSGSKTADGASDHTVKVDVDRLEPGATYFYRFAALGDVSPVGRLQTAPNPTEAAPVRFGLASCSNYEGGFFAGYRHLAEREDLSFVLHMGDYLYEYAPGAYGPGPEIGRVHEPDREIVSLEDYRVRHALYKTDPDLQACHAA